MTDYIVQRRVAMPSRKRKYPFKDMEVNDSFEFPIDERKRIHSAAVMHARRHGGKFSIRTIDSRRARCWRTE